MSISCSTLSASSFPDRPLAKQISRVRSLTPTPDNPVVSSPDPSVRGPAAGDSGHSNEGTTQVSELISPSQPRP